MVERSATSRRASSGAVVLPAAAISRRITSCVERRPLGSSVWSKSCVTARDALRRLLHAQIAAACA